MEQEFDWTRDWVDSKDDPKEIILKAMQNHTLEFRLGYKLYILGKLSNVTSDVHPEMDEHWVMLDQRFFEAVYPIIKPILEWLKEKSKPDTKHIQFHMKIRGTMRALYFCYVLDRFHLCFIEDMVNIA